MSHRKLLVKWMVWDDTQVGWNAKNNHCVRWDLLVRYSPAPISIKHLLDHGKSSDAKVKCIQSFVSYQELHHRAVSFSWSGKSRPDLREWSWSSGCSPPTCWSRRSAPRCSTTTSPASGSSSLLCSAFFCNTRRPQNKHLDLIILKSLCCNAFDYYY